MDMNLRCGRGHYSTQYTPVRGSAEEGVIDPSQRGMRSIQGNFHRIETWGVGLKAGEQARKRERHQQEYRSGRSSCQARLGSKEGKDRDESGKVQETKSQRAPYCGKEPGFPLHTMGSFHPPCPVVTPSSLHDSIQL